MPVIEVKAFEGRFVDDESCQLLIEKLTDGLVEVYGDGTRAETWVILEGVAPTRWGFGGKVRG